MKKITIILLLIFFANFIFAQTTITIYLGNGTPVNILNIPGVSNLNLVQDINSYNGTANTFIVSDKIQGGIFNVYTGPDLADGGMIFNDVNGRKFKRVTTTDAIFLKWYGVTPFTNYSLDVAPTIRKAIAYIQAHKKEFGTLQLEPCITNEWYYISSQISLNGIKLYGAGGQGRQPSTKFQCAAGFTAFDIRGDYAEIKDITISHYAPAVTSLDSNNHTFKIRTVVRFENVSIYGNPQGNGFDISGCGPALSTSADSIFGNPDHSIFLNCQAQFCLNGAYLKGCDANAILFQNCNFSQNAMWGVYDNGFLGNTYLTTHWAANSQNSNSGCRYLGTTYYPYPDSVYNIKGKRPDLFPNYWYATNFTGGNANWDTTKKYFGGGALWANNPNSNHAVISCYTEDFQANSIISPRSAWYEGTAGSPVVGGMWQHTFAGTTFFSGNGIATNGITTKGLTINSTVNGQDAYAFIQKDAQATANTTHILPKAGGTLKNEGYYEKAGDPTSPEIKNGTYEIYYNTTTGQMKLWANRNGGLYSIQLQ